MWHRLSEGTELSHRLLALPANVRPTLSPQWFTRSSPTVSSTTVYWPAHQRRWQPSCNGFSTQLRELCQTVKLRQAAKHDQEPTHFRRHVLHWLDVTDWIRFRLCIQMYKCQHSMAPGYLIDPCQPVTSTDGRRHICDLQDMVSCRFHESRWQSTKAILLHMSIHLLRMLCRTLSNAVHTVDLPQTSSRTFFYFSFY